MARTQTRILSNDSSSRFDSTLLQLCRRVFRSVLVCLPNSLCIPSPLCGALYTHSLAHSSSSSVVAAPPRKWFVVAHNFLHFMTVPAGLKHRFFCLRRCRRRRFCSLLVVRFPSLCKVQKCAGARQIDSSETRNDRRGTREFCYYFHWSAPPPSMVVVGGGGRRRGRCPSNNHELLHST